MSDSALASARRLRTWHRAQLTVVLAGLAVAVLFPVLTSNSFHLYIFTLVGIYALVAMGLNLLFGFAGQVSLGHGAIAGLGAYATAILSAGHGWNFWLAWLVGILVSVLAGTLLALPALRLSEWHFALVTLAMALIVRALLVEFRSVTNGWAGIVAVPRPAIAGQALSGEHFYWLVILILGVVYVAIRNLTRSRFGSAMVAVRDGPEAGRMSGVSVTRTKVGAFAFSAAIAGLAGGLFVALRGNITPDDVTVEFSLFFLIVVIIGGSGTLLGPVLGTLIFFAVPEFMDGLAEWRVIVYGLLLLALMTWAPDGAMGAARRLWRYLPTRDGDREFGPPTRGPSARLPDIEGATLDAHDIGKSFGGVQALQEVSLTVPASTIHGIVGTNGSGKTTLLNVISGFLEPDAGQVRLDGTVLPASTHEAARQGLGRTFQTPRLLPRQSVLENVLLGGYAHGSSGPLAAMLSTPAHRRETADAERDARHLLDMVGLGHRADDEAGALPHGQQRLVEIARALLGAPRLVLLDEPAAGLSMSELEALATLVRAIRDAGTTVVIVEHHLELVAELCDRVSVFDRGRVLATASTDAVLADPLVAGTYLGATHGL